MEDHSCWRCGSTDSASLFCQFCNSLQRPVTDYYRFFGLDKRLSLDAAELQARFYALSRKLHPDLYTRANPDEQRHSLEAASILNDGYRVLRDPVLRAEYMLKENHFDVAEQRTKDVPPELLEEVFDLNMQLDELRSGDLDARAPLAESGSRFKAMLAVIDSELQLLFTAYDAAPEGEPRRAELARIRALLNRRRYISNLVSEVDKVLAEHES